MRVSAVLLSLHIGRDRAPTQGDGVYSTAEGLLRRHRAGVACERRRKPVTAIAVTATEIRAAPLPGLGSRDCSKPRGADVCSDTGEASAIPRGRSVSRILDAAEQQMRVLSRAVLLAWYLWALAR